jgi:hypothetical protein
MTFVDRLIDFVDSYIPRILIVIVLVPVVLTWFVLWYIGFGLICIVVPPKQYDKVSKWWHKIKIN